MKFKFHLDIGLVGCVREEVVNIPDEDLDEILFCEYLPDWADQYIHFSWEKVEE